MSSDYKRVNILIRQDQAKELAGRKLSLSGLVRDLLDDRLSGSTIHLTVSPAIRKLYDEMVSNYGASDQELEKHLLKALLSFLKQKKSGIERLEDDIHNLIDDE